jgi:hypothetical protein
MLTTPDHKGSANQNHTKVPPHLCWNGYHQEHHQQMLQGFREKGTLIRYWWECKLVQPIWKTIWRLLKKLNIDLPHDPAISLLRIYLKECNAGYCKGTCTSMFIAALSTRAKLWKQTICSTIDE